MSIENEVLAASAVNSLSRGERVGVRAFGPSIDRTPSPGALARADLSPQPVKDGRERPDGERWPVPVSANESI